MIKKREHIIHNDSDENYEENSEKMRTIFLLFSKNHKKILEKYGKQTLMQMQIHQN